MKKFLIISATVLVGLTSFILLNSSNRADAAELTIYYSPSCPHCHHALSFINKELIPEYKKLKVIEVNVMENEANLDKFKSALKKCDFKTGGVPVIIINDKCFQGYADSMKPEFKKAIETK